MRTLFTEVSSTVHSSALHTSMGRALACNYWQGIAATVHIICISSCSVNSALTAYACKVQGQEYFEGGNSCVPCTGTCEKPTKVCTSGCCRGCGCPLGTVLDEEANACVNVTDCPKGESVTFTWLQCHLHINALIDLCHIICSQLHAEPSCPQECSHSFCQQNGANAECSV